MKPFDELFTCLSKMTDPELDRKLLGGFVTRIRLLFIHYLFIHFQGIAVCSLQLIHHIPRCVAIQNTHQNKHGGFQLLHLHIFLPPQVHLLRSHARQTTQRHVDVAREEVRCAESLGWIDERFADWWSKRWSDSCVLESFAGTAARSRSTGG